MNVLEIISSKQAEITQTYTTLEQQRDNANAEMLRLQGEHRAYEYIKEQLKERTDATTTGKPSRRPRNYSKR